MWLCHLFSILYYFSVLFRVFPWLNIQNHFGGKQMVTAKRGILFLLVFFILFISAMASYALTTTNSNKITAEEELYQKCKSAYTAKDIDSTNKLIKDFLSQYPQSNYNAELSFVQASIQSDVNKAIGTYKEIISKYPNSKWAGKANFQLGQCYYLLGKYNESAEFYREVVVHFPDDESYWQARYWRCKSLLAKGDYDGALDALNSLKESGNKEIGNDTILLSLGECYFAKKEYDKAEGTFRSLIDAIPDSKWMPSACFLLANTLMNLGKPEEANTFYKKVVESYPQSVEAKQAKKKLESPDKLIQSKTEKKVSPQLESQFLKASKEQKAPRTQVQANPPPPIKIQWKNDEEKKVVEAKPKEEPKDDPKTTNTASSGPYFSVQVGAYATKASADNITEQLKKKYTVDIIQTKVSGGKSIYKVLVGKFKTRDEAVKIAQKLNSEEKIGKTIIVSSE
jgi:TolA-binding protein